jgi:hypothetical protein
MVIILSHEYYDIVFMSEKTVTDFDYVISIKIICLINLIENGFLETLSSLFSLSLLFCLSVPRRSSENDDGGSLVWVSVSLFAVFETEMPRLFSISLPVIDIVLSGRVLLGPLSIAVSSLLHLMRL